MTRRLLKMFFKNRLTPFMAVLLAAATALLSVGCCLFYSVEETTRSVAQIFHTIPLITTDFQIEHTYKTDKRGNLILDQTGYPVRENSIIHYQTYHKLVACMAANSYLSRDQRRIYTGYSSEIQPMRSRQKLIQTVFGEYYDIEAGGSMHWEIQYRGLVLEATLLERIQASSGGDVFSQEYEGPGKSVWRGREEDKPEILVGPTYTYVFNINSAMAQTNYKSPLENLAEQKVYVTFSQEEEYPTGLKEGDRCLLYGFGFEQSFIRYSVLGKSYMRFSGGKIVAEEKYDSLSEEERFKLVDGEKKLLRMSVSAVSNEAGRRNYICLPGKDVLDMSNQETFVRFSGLNAEEGQRWYHIIQNCREGANGLGGITTQNSRNILTFNTKATQIIAGRHILPGDTEPVCIISGELAEENGLSVGDTLFLRLHPAEAKMPSYYNQFGKQEWFFNTDCEIQSLTEVSYRIVGIYQSMGWNENEYSNYFSPNTVFVSAVSTPEIERSPEQQGYWEKNSKRQTDEELEEKRILNTPQILWGYYLTESDQAQAFMDSLPEEVRRNIQLLDEGYEHIQPQLEALREQMKGIVLLTLGAWVLVAALFIFLCLFRGQSAMGTLRSLGAGVGYTFRQWLLLCLCLWLVSAGIGGVLSGVLYDKIEQKVFEAASYGEAYNQAFSDLGSAAEQGYNPYEGTQGHSGESAETVYRQVKDTLHIGRVLPLTILAQGGVFLLLCAVTLACLTRRKVPKLLRSM